MDLGPTTLTEDQVKRFHDDGYVVIKGAFAANDALAIQAEWWAELAEAHGIERDDRATWRQPRGDLKRAKTALISQRLASPRVCGVIDDLLGKGSWSQPRHWGRVLTTFPQEGVWDVPTHIWHSDSLYAWHREALNGLLIFIFIGPVRPGGGGTLILSGSPRLMRRCAEKDRAWRGDAAGARGDRDLFYGYHPWLMALSGAAPSPSDRIQRFMQIGVEIEGIPLRVIELTGEPGDVVFCHPMIAHTSAPNHNDFPRFMRIAGLMTQAGLDLRAGRRRR